MDSWARCSIINNRITSVYYFSSLLLLWFIGVGVYTSIAVYIGTYTMYYCMYFLCVFTAACIYIPKV